MAKTLNQFLEGYLKVKNPDEQKFVDKHVVAKHSDRNGNDDEVFNGSKVKMDDRRKTRHGYNPGEDEKVYEETGIKRIKLTKGWGDGGKSMKAGYGKLAGNQHKIDANKNGKVDAHDFELLRKKKKVAEEAEQIDEVNVNQIKKDLDSGMSHDAVIGKHANKRTTNTDAIRKVIKQHAWDKRMKKEEVEQIDEISAETKASYMKKAAGEIGKLYDKSKTDARSAYKYYGRKNTMRKIANEEVELEEKLTAKTPMATYIKDFQKSDAPQFKGKSQEKRRAMAIAAKLTAERGGQPLRKEEKLADLLGDLTESHRRTMLSVFDKLNESNQKKFLEACETPEGVESMLDFAISHRGE